MFGQLIAVAVTIDILLNKLCFILVGQRTMKSPATPSYVGLTPVSVAGKRALHRVVGLAGEYPRRDRPDSC